MKEKVTINPELEDVAEKLRKVRWNSHYIPDVILDLSDYMAEISEKTAKYGRKFIAETMVFLIDDAKKSIETGRLDLNQEKNILIPDRLKGKAEEINKKIFYLILVIDRIASEEFSKKFRELFIMYFSK